MKTTAALMIGADLVHVSDYHLLLELGACGRGYLTAELDADCTGSLVRFDLGVGDSVYRWFTGYVERCGDAERVYKRLFVRELAGALNKTLPVSLQHPTLREVCATLSALTDLQFSIPPAEYADTKIPHFKSAGKWFALLDSLGGAFSIPDYCWQQLPDGVIYVGSYNDSRFARADVEIPTDFIKTGSAGSGVKLAIIPALRPGVVVNGQRITQVEIENGDMQLRWTPKTAPASLRGSRRKSGRLIKPILSFLPVCICHAGRASPARLTWRHWVTFTIPSGRATPPTCSCLTQTAMMPICLSLLPCRCRYRSLATRAACSSSLQREPSLRWDLLTAGQISR